MKRLSLTPGFSLVELLVVVSIVSILSAVMYFNISEGSEQARDVERKADLRELQSALEQYKLKYGQYPAGCNGYTSDYSTVWSGQSGTTYSCASGNEYIVGLAPEFIPRLPTDPKLNGANSGYVYTTNNERSVYKIMALDTVETETVVPKHPFSRCGEVNGSQMCARVPSVPSGNNPYGTEGSTPNECNNSSLYGAVYAISSGFSNDNRSNNNNPERGKEYDTEIVRCK